MDDVRLAVPSRLVTLASRLVLAEEKGYRNHPPAHAGRGTLPSAHSSRRSRCRSFRAKLVKFFTEKRAERNLRAARDLLTKNTFCEFPPVLAADMARRSPDTLFLLLRWIDRMHENGDDPGAMNEAATLRVLGAVTALSWFAERESQCLSNVWPKVQSASGSGVKTFFSMHFVPNCLKPTVSGKIGLLPLVPPQILEEAVRASVFGHGFNSPDGNHWQKWNWAHLSDRALVSKKGKETHLHRWYRRTLKESWTTTAIGDDDGDTVRRRADFKRPGTRSSTNCLTRRDCCSLHSASGWLGGFRSSIPRASTSARKAIARGTRSYSR